MTERPQNSAPWIALPRARRSRPPGERGERPPRRARLAWPGPARAGGRVLVLGAAAALAFVRAARGWWADTAIAGALAVLMALGLLGALTQRYSFDAINYAWQIEQFHATGKLGLLLHPHHLLFNTVGYLWWQALQPWAGASRALEAQQMLSAVSGGAALAFCYAAARAATGSRLLALAAVVLTSASLGVWMIATDGGIYPLGFALCVAAVWRAMRLLERPSRRGAVALAAVAAAAALVHQMHMLLGVAVALAPFLSGRGWRRRVELVALTLVTYGGILLAAYWLAAGMRGHWSPAGVLHWATQYGHDGRWWDFDLAKNLRLDLLALARHFSDRPAELLERAAQLFNGDGALMAAGVPALLLGGGLLRRGKPLLLCGAWLLPYVAFFTVWVPGYVAYWVPMGFGLLLVLILLVEGTARALPRRRLRRSLGLTVRLAVLAVACFAARELWSVNGPAVQQRARAGANPYLAIAADVERHTRGQNRAAARASDLVLIAGTGYYAYLETYLPYFAQRGVVTLAGACKQGAKEGGYSQLASARWLEERFRRSWERGADVYIFSDVLGDGAAFAALEARYGLTAEDARRLLARYRLEPAFKTRGRVVYRAVSPEEKAWEGEAWGAAASPPRGGEAAGQAERYCGRFCSTSST